MSTKKFSYQWADQDQINEHVAKVSRQAIYVALHHYRSTGNVELVQRIELALLNAKLFNLKQQAERLLHNVSNYAA